MEGTKKVLLATALALVTVSAVSCYIPIDTFPTMSIDAAMVSITIITTGIVTMIVGVMPATAAGTAGIVANLCVDRESRDL